MKGFGNLRGRIEKLAKKVPAGFAAQALALICEGKWLELHDLLGEPMDPLFLIDSTEWPDPIETLIANPDLLTGEQHDTDDDPEVGL